MTGRGCARRGKQAMPAMTTTAISAAIGSRSGACRSASAIASAYVDARYYQEALALTRQSLESRKRTLALTREQDVLGSVSRIEVLQAEQLVTQAEAALPALEVGRDQAINRLATLTAGRSADIAAQLERDGVQVVKGRGRVDGTRQVTAITDDEALVDRLVPAGHPSTPGYTDPAYPVEGRVTG